MFNQNILEITEDKTNNVYTCEQLDGAATVSIQQTRAISLSRKFLSSDVQVRIFCRVH